MKTCLDPCQDAPLMRTSSLSKQNGTKGGDLEMHEGVSATYQKIVRIPCGDREVNMTEYLDTWKTSLEESGMRVSRPKTQFMDFAFDQNEYETREHIQIL